MTRNEAARLAWGTARWLDNERMVHDGDLIPLTLTPELALQLATALEVLSLYAEPLEEDPFAEPLDVPGWLARQKRQRARKAQGDERC